MSESVTLMMSRCCLFNVGGTETAGLMLSVRDWSLESLDGNSQTPSRRVKCQRYLYWSMAAKSSQRNRLTRSVGEDSVDRLCCIEESMMVDVGGEERKCSQPPRMTPCLVSKMRCFSEVPTFASDPKRQGRAQYCHRYQLRRHDKLSELAVYNAVNDQSSGTLHI